MVECTCSWREECERLRVANLELSQELKASQSYAQQCEDEAVELRRQLCELLRKPKTAARQDAEQLQERPEDAVMETLKTSKPASMAQPMGARSTCKRLKSPIKHEPSIKPPTRRDGLRSSSKHTAKGINSKIDVQNGDLPVSSPNTKRKAEVAEPESETTKRARTDEADQQVSNEISLEDSIDMIKDLNSGWNERITAIQRVGEILTGAAVAKDEVSGSLPTSTYEKLFSAFAAQVVRETCLVISKVAQKDDLKSRFAAGAKVLLPALFKLTYVTIKIMSESALECIDNLVVALPPAVVLHYLEIASQDMHAQTRSKSAACLGLILSKGVWQDDLEKLSKVVEELLERGLEDVSPDTRAGARAAFQALHAVCPERAAALLGRAKEQVRKQVASLGPAVSASATGDKATKPRSTKRTDFRAARLHFRSNNAQSASAASAEGAAGATGGGEGEETEVVEGKENVGWVGCV